MRFPYLLNPTFFAQSLVKILNLKGAKTLERQFISALECTTKSQEGPVSSEFGGLNFAQVDIDRFHLLLYNPREKILRITRV